MPSFPQNSLLLSASTWISHHNQANIFYIFLQYMTYDLISIFFTWFWYVLILLWKYVEISLYDYGWLWSSLYWSLWFCLINGFFISHLIRWSVSQDGGGLLRCCRLQLASCVLDLPGASGAARWSWVIKMIIAKIWCLMVLHYWSECLWNDG